ncbi:MAG: hypothetical protein IJN48_03100, partial [Clostridia bacterium]|nr:hypothetical protein [Clostridia bacterium]
LKNDIYGSYLDIFISSLLCGVLIFIAIHGFRKVGGFAGCAILITASTMIMMCDFEYSLFNVFTVSAGIQNVSSYAALSLPIVAVIFLSAIGNALGAIIFASLYRFKENTDDSHRRHHHNHHHSNNTENKEEAGN